MLCHTCLFFVQSIGQLCETKHESKTQIYEITMSHVQHNINQSDFREPCVIWKYYIVYSHDRLFIRVRHQTHTARAISSAFCRSGNLRSLFQETNTNTYTRHRVLYNTRDGAYEHSIHNEGNHRHRWILDHEYMAGACPILMNHNPMCMILWCMCMPSESIHGGMLV